VIFKDYLLPQRNCNGFKESTKKSVKLQSIQKTLFQWGRLFPNMVKYGQKSTFDRTVVETQFFNQNDQNEILKIFP
jgi:hypothetical protein